MHIQIGTIVRPNHRGESADWARLRGRVFALWHTPGHRGEPVADIVWFGDARQLIGRYTTGYPLRQLRVADPLRGESA